MATSRTTLEQPEWAWPGPEPTPLPNADIWQGAFDDGEGSDSEEEGLWETDVFDLDAWEAGGVTGPAPDYVNSSARPSISLTIAPRSFTSLTPEHPGLSPRSASSSRLPSFLLDNSDNDADEEEDHGDDGASDSSEFYGFDAWQAEVARIAREMPPASAASPAAQQSDAQPSTSQGASGETHDEVYWPNIEEYLATRTGSRPIVTCVVCQTNELVIDGLQPRTSDGDQEDTLVLDCDHVVGEKCWFMWVDAQQQNNRVIKCPVCNSPVE